MGIWLEVKYLEHISCIVVYFRYSSVLLSMLSLIKFRVEENKKGNTRVTTKWKLFYA